jgi:putative flippase GtrA
MGCQKRRFLKEFIVFNLIGLVNTLFTYGIYSLLVFLGTGYRLALLLEYCVGMTVSFFLNKKFTFHHTQKARAGMLFSMAASYICVFLINLSLLVILVEKFLVNTYVGQLIALAVSVGLSFLAQKYVVFRKNP